MLAQILSLFPPNTHPLTLVSDPDRMLGVETVMSAIIESGFQVIQEDDPVFLHHLVEEIKPFTSEFPVIIITTGALENLPYTQYQIAYKVRLSLHQFFPNLSYPILQTLKPDQIEKLATKKPPNRTLSRTKTIDYILEEVFEINHQRLSQPHGLIAWLDDYHHRHSPLPELLRNILIERLKCQSICKDWQIEQLVGNMEFFNQYVQDRWKESIENTLSGNRIRDISSEYKVLFESDPRLQDLVPGLVRSGTLKPLEIVGTEEVPGWAQAGVSKIDSRIRRRETLFEVMSERIKTMNSNKRGSESWSFWQEVSQDWAELVGYCSQTDLPLDQNQRTEFIHLISEMDTNFVHWLQRNYTSLGANRLPQPKHVYHIPHYLQYMKELGKVERSVLLVLDGLSLADWKIIKETWVKRSPQWRFQTDLMIAQIPTVTFISRYALVSGLMPREFLVNQSPRVSEAQAWKLFWSRSNVPTEACDYLTLSYDRQINQEPELEDPRVKHWCLIDDTIDKLTHHATLGAADQLSSLKLWLDPDQNQNSLKLEKTIDSFLDRGYIVFIASDHGHVEATGFGAPSEGLIATTRGKRARIYDEESAATQIQSSYEKTVLWNNDGILPDHMTALIPLERDAFAIKGDVVVTHGGITIDEVVVPFVRISKESV